MDLWINADRSYLFLKFIHIKFQQLTFVSCQLSALVREAK